MNIKFSIITRGSMLVSYGGKTVTVSGELILSPPTFYADIASLKNWDPPYSKERISEEEKKEIVDFITREGCKQIQTKIIVD